MASRSRIEHRKNKPGKAPAKGRAKPRPAPHRRVAWWIPAAAAGGLVVILLAGFVGMMRLEETNTFCGWCHTQPESTYRARMTAAAKVDLASDHFAKKL